MELIKRRIFFWSLVAVFFVVAPGVVLYAHGYRFNLKRGVFVHSGSITIKSNPQSVDIKLNDELNSSKTLNRINSSYNLNGLIPGSYAIDISSPDFQSWDKKWDVHSGLSTEFWNVLLVRKNYIRTDYPAIGVDSFYISPKNDLVAYSKKTDTGLNVSLLNISQKTVDKSFDMPGWNFISEARRENIEWSPDQNYISIPVKRDIAVVDDSKKEKTTKGIAAEPANRQETQYQYFVADIANNSSFNLNDFLGKNDIKDVRWDPKEKGYIFFMEGDILYRANVADKKDIAAVVPDASAYDLSGSILYFIQGSNNLVFKTSLDGLSERVQITNDFPEADQNISRMIVYNEKEIAFTSDRGNFYVYNHGEHDNYFRKLASGVIGSHFSNDGKKLLFWTDNEISVYFAHDWLVQPVRNENDMTNITRYSEPIKNVQWFKDFEHVIFNTGKYIKIIELDSRDHRNSQDLISTAIDNPFVIYNGSMERLFITDKPTDGDSLIQSIIFPEPTPLLGIGG